LQLKDLNEFDLAEEIESYTVKFELESMINTKSKHLSGGMKRKLSVAIALIGKSKVRDETLFVGGVVCEVKNIRRLSSFRWC